MIRRLIASLRARRRPAPIERRIATASEILDDHQRRIDRLIERQEQLDRQIDERIRR